MKVINLEHHQEQHKLKAQVAAPEAQIAKQSLPGPSTAPAGTIENG